MDDGGRAFSLGGSLGCMNNDIQLLAQTEFFDGMDPLHLEVIANLAEQVHFDEGETILSQGDEASAFYIVLSGSVTLEVGPHDGEQIPIAELRTDDILGVSWIFPPYRWRFTARAATPVDALMIHAIELRMDSNLEPTLGYELMRRFASVMAGRLQATRLELIDRLREG